MQIDDFTKMLIEMQPVEFLGHLFLLLATGMVIGICAGLAVWGINQALGVLKSIIR